MLLSSEHHHGDAHRCRVVLGTGWSDASGCHFEHRFLVANFQVVSRGFRPDQRRGCFRRIIQIFWVRKSLIVSSQVLGFLSKLMLDGPKKQSLDEVLANSHVMIRYLDYDWSLNAWSQLLKYFTVEKTVKVLITKSVLFFFTFHVYEFDMLVFPMFKPYLI